MFNFPDIPELFYSEYSEEPFDTCIDCGCELLDDMVYVIQKHYVAGEAVFEMAMCMHCQQSLGEQLSDESREAIHRYLTERKEQQSSDEENDDEADIGIIAFPKPEPTWQEMLNQCVFCGAERSACHRHAISGVFRGAEMIIHQSPAFGLHWPLVVCEPCVSKTNELMSKKTRDTWDRFVEDHFDGPPGIEQDWPSPHNMMV